MIVIRKDRYVYKAARNVLAVHVRSKAKILWVSIFGLSCSLMNKETASVETGRAACETGWWDNWCVTAACWQGPQPRGALSVDLLPRLHCWYLWVRTKIWIGVWRLCEGSVCLGICGRWAHTREHECVSEKEMEKILLPQPKPQKYLLKHFFFRLVYEKEN